MGNDWHSMNDNQLRAHLDSALAERQGFAVLEDCGYSDEEFGALTREFQRRRFQLIGLRRNAVAHGAERKEH